MVEEEAPITEVPYRPLIDTICNDVPAPDQDKEAVLKILCRNKLFKSGVDQNILDVFSSRKT